MFRIMYHELTTCSNCFFLLKQNQDDYSKLLHVDDECIPDPLSLHTGWLEEKLGLSKWPPVYITDIVNFLVTRKLSASVQTILNEYKVGKAYEYFKSGHLQEVYYHCISSASSNCILSAKCTPSQKMKSDSQTVWVCCCKESGAIKSAYCTCTAGLGSTCNHVAGLLFRVESANKVGATSCTSLPCAWTVPSGLKTVEPCKLKNMAIRKSGHGEAEKRPLTSKGKSSFDPIGKTSIDKGEMLSVFSNALKHVLPNSCLKRGTECDSIDLI